MSFFRTVMVIGVGISGISLVHKFVSYNKLQNAKNGDLPLDNVYDIWGNPIISDLYGNIKPNRFDENDKFRTNIGGKLLRICACNGLQGYGLYSSMNDSEIFDQYLGLYIDTNWNTKGKVYGDSGEDVSTGNFNTSTGKYDTIKNDTWQWYIDKLTASNWGKQQVANGMLSQWQTNPYQIYQGVGSDLHHPNDNSVIGVIDGSGKLCLIDGLDHGIVNPLTMCVGTIPAYDIAIDNWLKNEYGSYVTTAIDNNGKPTYQILGYCLVNNVEYYPLINGYVTIGTKEFQQQNDGSFVLINGAISGNQHNLIQDNTVFTNGGVATVNNNPVVGNILNGNTTINNVVNTKPNGIILDNTKQTIDNVNLGGATVNNNKDLINGANVLFNTDSANSLTSIGNNSLFTNGFNLIDVNLKGYNGNQPKSQK